MHLKPGVRQVGFRAGVARCHLNGVVHRDLKPEVRLPMGGKPENFLFANKTEESPLKATDFGLSDFRKPGKHFTVVVGSTYYVAPRGKHFTDVVGSAYYVAPEVLKRRSRGGKHFTDVVGSAYYVAPEVLKRRSGPESDVWSIGVITYILLSGRRPFWDKTEAGIFNEVLKMISDFRGKPWPQDLSCFPWERGRERLRVAVDNPCFSLSPSHQVLKKKPDFREKPWPQISTSAKDFVKKLLKKDPRARPTAAQALSHPWVKEGGNASSIPLDIAVLSNMREFVKYSRLKQMALKALATTLESTEVQQLRDQFNAMDINGDGTITIDEIRHALNKDLPYEVKETKVVQILQAALNKDLPYEVKESEVVQILQAMDTNCDGIIDFDEFVAATLHVQQLEEADSAKWEERSKAAFNHFDTDGDGFIDAEELRVAAQVKGSLGRLIDEGDVDGDGRISLPEFQKLLRCASINSRTNTTSRSRGRSGFGAIAEWFYGMIETHDQPNVQMVRLIREPNNAYDRNAIRVDNIRGQKVGHVEAKMACHLAPLVDAGLVAIEAPEAASRLLSARVALVETNSLPGSDTFGEASPSGSLQAASAAASVAAALAARRAAMSQAEQDKAVLSMFDDLACQVEADRPTADPPCHVIRSSLLPHQQRALAWMIKRESAKKLPPFWKAGALESGSSSKGKRGGRGGGGRGAGRQGRGGRGRGSEVQGGGAGGVEGGAGGGDGEEDDGDDGGEGGGRVFTNILTNFTTEERPKALRGGILADDMGLGKTLSLLSLVASTSAAAADAGETQAIGTSSTGAADGVQGEQSRATLVVCPLSVLSNWTAQLAEHVAPGALSYYVYHGAERVRDPSFLSGFDLVFTTYNILASECPPSSASTAAAAAGGAAAGAAGGSSAGAGRGGARGMAEAQYADSPPPSPPSIPGCPGMLMPAYAGMPGARGRKRKAPGAAAQGQRKRGGMAGTAGGAGSSSRSTAGASTAGGAGAETAGGGPLMQVKWRRVILDEAHVIKSVRTRAARAATALQAERRWAVTGTPVQNQLGDLFSLLCFLRLDPLNDRLIWTRAIERPMRERQHIGLDRLRALVLTTALRRTKDMQVNGRPLLSLPPKTVRVLPIDLLPEDRDLYDQVQEEVRRLVGGMMAQGTLMKNYATVLEMILRLRQIADHKGLCPPHVLEAIAASAAAAEEADRNQDAKAAVPLDPLLSQKLQELLAAGAADEDCPICLSPPTLPVITPCSHIFCRRCIRRVLSIQKHACPMCRAPVDEAHLVEAPPDAAEGEGSGANGDHSKGGLMEGVEGNTSAKIDALIAALREPLQVPPGYQPPEGGAAIAGPSAMGGGDGRQQQRVKSVVFSQFTRMLDLVYERLQAAGFKCCRLDGRTKLSVREKAIAEFNRVDDDSPTVFLVGLRAAGVGLNLTAASRVFLLEPWWNPAVEQQAMDRVHRIGQVQYGGL
ncbi:unnamed protein product [Closterium sp. NIES-65]|nr:unnamed protein product [Closterium sp. NIES-65]